MTFGATAASSRSIPSRACSTAEDWSALEAGLSQRVRALDAFVADVYGARRSSPTGVVPGAT